MKDKKSTVYLLLILCVVIWGTIGWKVYTAFQDDAPVVVQELQPIVKVEKKTTALLLNYRDPFLGGYPKVKTQEKTPPVQQPVAKEAYRPQEEVFPDFQYKGIIRIGKATQAIVYRNGESLMLKPKDTVGEFSILQITDDKLVVSRKNKKYDLPIQ